MKRLFKIKKLMVALGILVCVLFPSLASMLLSNPKYIIKIGVFIVIYIIAVSGLDVLYGYCGQISMGHAAFFAIGAYSCAIITDYFKMPILLSMFISCLISVIIAVIIAYPTSKLKFHFLSLATIAFGEIVYAFLQASPNEITGNVKGYFPQPLKLFGLNFSKDYSLYYYLVLIIAVLLLIVKQNIIKSRIGRGFIAIRENPIAANGMGINVRKYKIVAFAISAFYVALAGSLYAHFVNYISPGLFTYDQSVSLMTMLIFGGSGTLFGPIVGVISIQTMNELIRGFDKYQALIYGAIILMVVIFMPNGIVGIKQQLKSKRGKKDATRD